MTLQVIGAGFGRTGTLSLKLALEQLGFGPCYHMTEVFGKPDHVAAWRAAAQGDPVDWDALFDGYQAAVDWPASAFWDTLALQYPQAKIVLSLRDAESWHRSVMNTIWPSSQRVRKDPDPVRQDHAAMLWEVIWDGTFEGRIEDADFARQVFEQHNARARTNVTGGRLLVLPVGSRWEPLCAFLGVPVPDTPYPKVNSTDDFTATMTRMREER